jgi:DNA-binding response OmpR family regulator
MTEETSSEEKVILLVVSDDPLIQEEARYGFSDRVELRTALDSRQAWKIMNEEPPTIVLADIQTGSAGGFGLAKDMSARKTLADIPILMLLERPQDDWLARQAGASSSRVKPVEVSELVREVMRLVSSTPKT